MILTGQETREQLVVLTGSAEAADEVQACALFMQVQGRGPVMSDFARETWAAWARGELTGAEVLERLRADDVAGGATACRSCGCTDNVACAGGCVWTEPLGDLCSRCAS